MSQAPPTELQDRAETITSLDAIQTTAHGDLAVEAGVTRQAVEQRLDELVVNRQSVKIRTGGLKPFNLDYTRWYKHISEVRPNGVIRGEPDDR